jgi:hypothetical protein
MDICMLADIYKLTQSCKLAATTYLLKSVLLTLINSDRLTLYPRRRFWYWRRQCSPRPILPILLVVLARPTFLPNLVVWYCQVMSTGMVGGVRIPVECCVVQPRGVGLDN